MFRVAGVLLIVMLGMGVVAGSASATLPGKNGKLLVSSYGEFGDPVSWQQWLFTSNLSGHSGRYLGKPNESFYDASIAPGGRRIAYSRYPGYQLYIGSASNPEGARAITREVEGLKSSEAVFAPDGQSVYFSVERSGEESRSWRIKRFKLRTGRVQTFPGDAQKDWGLSDVSPDGKVPPLQPR